MPARIGDSVRRKEDLRLLTGRGCFSDDFNFPGQAYAAALRAPHAHALIRRIDTLAARKMPRVIAVLTGEDARTAGLNAIPHLATPGAPPDIVLHNRDGSPVPIAPHPLLPTDRVRHVGTAVAFVIAETLAAAKDAAERIIVDYEDYWRCGCFRLLLHCRSPGKTVVAGILNEGIGSKTFSIPIVTSP